jgi:hypothetical protein
MAVIRLYMTMSLDGFVAGPRDRPDAPLGTGGFRLFNWLDRRDDPGPSGQVLAECRPPGRSSLAAAPTNTPAAGRATTTTASRSSS